MNIKLFYHSLVSDWNHGNAHFLRGIVAELLSRGHKATVYEPADGWSYENLLKEKKGQDAIYDFKSTFPLLKPTFYYPEETNLEELVQDADLVIVHEWNPAELVEELGELKSKFGYKLLFHDTHHRSVSKPEEMSAYNLSNYDGVLAFGEIIRDIYLKNKWTDNAWTWHEAADTRVFYPKVSEDVEGDLVWIGNWGDNERKEELQEFLINPVKELGLKAKIYGVRYPKSALKMLEDAGIEYGGWLPNHKAPEVFSKYRFTVHVPRRPYTKMLPGIPTIRPFEALACGIPLISSPWKDAEGLFNVGQDFMMVQNGEEMKKAMKEVLNNPYIARNLSNSGLQTIRDKHTCRHRVTELLDIVQQLKKEKPLQEV